MKKSIFSKTLAALLVLTLVAGLALTGCGDKSGDASGKKSEEISVIVGPEPKTIDPALNTAVDGGILALHFFEGLTKYDEKGKISEGVAKKIDVSEDGLTYTFHLRDSKWSDGKPVTAKDFVYAWKRLVDPRTAADYSYMIEMVKGASDVISADPKNPAAIEAALEKMAISAPDDKTFKVELIAKTPFFLDICAFPSCMPVREDIVANNDKWTQDPKTYVSNGPYKMTEWKHQAVIKAVKNENYYNKKMVGPKVINFNLVEDANANLSAFKNKEVVFVDDIPNQELKSMEGNGLKISPQLGTYYLCLNNNDPVMKNPKIRKALALAIDRHYIVEKVSMGGEKPADAFVPVGVKGEKDGVDFNKDAKKWYSIKKSDYEKNVKKAKKLLAEAGYPDGKGLPTIEIIYNTNGNHQPIMEAVQNMWKENLGVNSNLSGQEWNVFIQTRKDGKYQAARHGWIADYDDPISFLDMWQIGGGNNDAKYNNPEYDKLIEKIKATSDPAERFKDMHKAEAMLAEDVPVIPIYFYSDPMLVSDDLKGVVITNLGFKLFTYVK